MVTLSTVSEVRRISSDTIKSTTHSNSTQRLDLTPWDLKMLALHGIQKGLLFRKPNGSTWIYDLKISMSLVLNHFFPLAGRLATEEHEDGGITVYIKCNNAGAEFIHAKAEVSLSEVLNPLHVPHIVNDFFSLGDSINYDGRFQPLLSVQVTELLDGIFIGFTMNHSIADGSTFWNFINSWSSICKSKSHQISHAPNFNRWFYNLSNLPIRFPISTIENSIKSYNMPQLEERVFHFAPDNVAKLKAKANLENKSKNLISSLQAVLAHVWRAVIHARRMGPNEETCYLLFIGNRGRLISPHLPKEYFGNSIDSVVARAKTGELIEKGLGFAATLLNQVVSFHTNDKICSTWETWVRKPAITSFDDLDSKILSTGSSPRFNMYGNDFGWGCPIGVRSGRSNKFDGKLTIYPGAVKGSMEIEACLLPKTLMALGEDSDFMEFVGPTSAGNGV